MMERLTPQIEDTRTNVANILEVALQSEGISNNYWADESRARILLPALELLRITII